MRPMPAPCEEIAAAMPSMLDGTAAALPGVVSHVERCLRCQAEMARYRTVLRMLQQLRLQRPEMPAGLLSDVLDALESAAKRKAVRSALSGRRLAFGSVAAALVAAGTAACVIAWKGRPERLDRLTEARRGA